MLSQYTEATNRRTFLKATGTAVTVGVAGLAGCSGSDSDGDETTAGGTTTSDDTAELKEEYELAEVNYELEDELNIFQWSEYWHDDLIPTFEAVFDVDVTVANFATNTEMLNKLQAGGTDQYDLVFPTDHMIEIMAEQEIIRELDLEKIPNFDNLGDRFQNPAYDPGEGVWSAPYQWGTSGIGWNEDVIGDAEITSWDAMWDEEYAGQITMMNEMRETIGAALKRLGYSLNSTDPDEIAEAKETLIQQKDLLLTYDSTEFNIKLVNEQASPVHGWSGDVFRAYWETYEDGSSPVNYRVPDEGGLIWVDNGVITRDALHPNAAHAFINYYLNAQVGASITNWTYFASPNEAAEEDISDDITEDPAIYPPDSVMENLEYMRALEDAREYYSDAWEEIKNA